MQTVRFQCDKCGKEMAVGDNLLGKQVLCPHCRQVVQAPASATSHGAPPAAPEPVFNIPAVRSEEEGSIFGEVEAEGDDLFGGAPKLPKVELPPAPPVVPNMQLGSAAAPNVAVSSPEAVPDMFSAEAPYADAESPLMNRESAPSSARRLAQQRARQESVFTSYLLIILIPYAILMTVFAVYFYYKSQRDFSTYELLPDPAAYKYSTFKRVEDSRPLPDKLRAGLEQTIRVGDLEITPLKVEQRKIVYNTFGTKDASVKDALVVTLEVKNISSNIQFQPNDLFFNRKWDDNAPSANKPYTCLEVGEKRFYGGPSKWVQQHDQPGRRESDRPEIVEGSSHNTELKPGDKMTMIVCTNPDNDAVLQAVRAHAGPLTYRVQLRRGLFRQGQREGTVTAVVGVDFTKEKIHDLR